MAIHLQAGAHHPVSQITWILLFQLDIPINTPAESRYRQCNQNNLLIMPYNNILIYRL